MLKEALAWGGTGGGALGVVCGEAGVGKTALLRSFRRRQPGATVLWATCDPLFTPASLRGLVRHSRGFRGPSAGPPSHRGQPAPSSPGLGPRASFATADVVGAWEDLQFADEATLDVFTLLVRRPRRRRPWCVGPTATMRSRTPTRFGESSVSWRRNSRPKAETSTSFTRRVGQLAAPHGVPNGREPTRGPEATRSSWLKSWPGEREDPGDGEGRRAGPGDGG